MLTRTTHSWPAADKGDKGARLPRGRLRVACSAFCYKPRLCVIGGGVIGLSTACRIAEEVPDVEVELQAEHLARSTTSEGAGGFWEPYKLSNTPPDLINAWGSETYDFLQGLYRSPDAEEAGVSEVPAYQLWSRPAEDPPWRDIPHSFRALGQRELAAFNQSGCGAAEGYAFTTLCAEQRRFLPFLVRRALAAGVTLTCRQLTSLEALVDYDVVVNCTGLGAARLFSDSSLFPVRGHVIRVRAPWVKAVYFLDHANYILPNIDTVVLGGTAQQGDFDCSPREEDRRHIWEGCLKLMPSLAAAKVDHEWVGLRPGRDSVRLEREEVAFTTSNGSSHTLEVVHNYGHGGAGFTLCWGCAGHAARLVEEALAAQRLCFEDNLEEGF